ncbi:MAG: thiol peroxidase [Nitrospirales bacterium]
MNDSFWKVLIMLNLAVIAGCGSFAPSKPQGFTYQQIPVTTETAKSGNESTILFRGTPLPLSGSAISVGETLRTAPLATQDLSLIDLTDRTGTVKVISIVPSLDTKVCEQQTHYLSEKNEGLDKQVTLITISIDTPFAQKRFAEEANISNVEFLSDFRGGDFGEAHGLLLPGPHVLSRSVMVVDTQNTIRHLQITPDLGQLPDMDEAFRVAKALAEKG